MGILTTYVLGKKSDRLAADAIGDAFPTAPCTRYGFRWGVEAWA
jgi:hypothetical protein